MLEQNEIQVPRDRMELNRWFRHYYLTNPFVREIIDLHSVYPLQHVRFTCENAKQASFFALMCKEMNLETSLLGIAKEFWKTGEAIVFVELSETYGRWKEPHLLDDAIVHRTYAGNIVEHEGERLDPRNVSIIANQLEESDERGTSILLSSIKTLMLNDAYKKYNLKTDSSGLVEELLFGGDLKQIQNSYIRFRVAIKDWLVNKIFKPILEIEQYEFDHPVVVSWPKLDLSSDAGYLRALEDLRNRCTTSALVAD